MKKFLIAIIFIIVVLTLTSSCASTSVDNLGHITNDSEPSDTKTTIEKEYTYADDWSVPKELSEASVVRELYTYTKESEYDILPLKEEIREDLKQYDYLDWDKFERLSSVRVVKITKDDIPNFSYEEITIISSYAAFYDDETDSILICPAFFEYEDDEQRLYAVIHEIVHSLVSNNRHKADHLDEGVVDVLALKVVDNLDIDCRPGYQIAILVTEWLTTIFGEDEYFKAIHDGTAEQMIDDATKDGLGRKLNYAMILAHDKEYPSEELNVAYDILVHLARNTGKTASVEDLLQKDNMLFSYAGININADYFEKLLKS